jgi:uncharacterized repeat protein (TIGR01451 family)
VTPDPDNNLDTSTTTITVHRSMERLPKRPLQVAGNIHLIQTSMGPIEFMYSVCDTGVPVYCDTTTVYITVTPLTADLAILKTSAASTYTAGDTVTWTITVTNAGPDTATAALVNDDINNS